jgi:hypothetical protein
VHPTIKSCGSTIRSNLLVRIAVSFEPMLPLIRAAVEAAPYEHPKLTAVSVGYHDGTAFADRLDRAIEASNRAKLIEGRVIERDD